MKIDLQELANQRNPSVFSSIVFSSLTKDIMDKILPPEGETKKEYDFTLTIDGHELNVKEAFDHIEKEFYRNIEAKAHDMLKEKYGEVEKTIEDLGKKVLKHFKDAHPGVQWDEEVW